MRTFQDLGVALAALALALPLAQDEATAPEQAPVEPYAGTLAEGLRELERLTDEASYAEALALTESLLAPTDFLRWRRRMEVEHPRLVAPLVDLAQPAIAWLGLDGYPEPVRAEVHYARGLVRRAAEEPAEAVEAFAEARALAGPGELRLASMYNRGLTVLEEGERWRAQIPEVQGRAPARATPQPAPAPMGPPAAGAPAPDEEDPLELAREAYLRAREHLVERLRADWRDPDTRANVELIQRRLKELDEIERQREEEEQEQEQEQHQDQQQQQSPQDQPPPEDQERQEDEEEQPPQDPQESEQEQQEQEQEQEEEGAPEDEEQPEEQLAEQQAAEEEPEEVYLTREEVQRLLERLREHEEEGEMVKERLHQTARKGVRRDW